MEIIEFNNRKYPTFQSKGNAAQFALPFAKHFCKGVGFDIGCNREEWSYPGSILIDPALNEFNSMNLPDIQVDYIFSSHCLEHLPNWVESLDYWLTFVKPGGYLFLYLPHYDQEYWRPWNNRKHIHCFTPNIIEDYLNAHKNTVNVFVSDRDLNNSFIAVCEKVC
jgi:SAM-dependent methyltransferase